MYNIILVDDEYAVIEILQEIIDFEKYGFHLAGIYDDGREALEAIKKSHIDVVVSDIEMPEYSGLDLVSDLRRMSKDIEIVFLSAYPNFEYAAFGIDYDVFKYVLKPVTIKNFTETLTALKGHLDKKHTEENVFDNNVSVSLQNAFYDLLYKEKGMTLGEISKLIEKEGYEYDLNTDYATIIDMNLIDEESDFSDNRGVGFDTMLHILKNLMCRKEFLVCPLIYTPNSIKVLMICHTNDGIYFLEKLNQFKEQLAEDIVKVLNFQVTISQERIFTNINKLVDYVKVYDVAHYDAKSLIELIKNLQISVQNISEIISGKQKKYGKQSMYMEIYSYSIYQLISTYVSQEDMLKVGIYQNIQLPLKMNLLEVPIQIEVMVRQLPQTTEKLLTYFASNAEKETGAAEQAIAYIKENYTKDITLEYVAKYVVYRNPVYLSRCIREHTQMTFPEYLNQMRITKAKELLITTDDSASDIANIVGYSSIGYFHKKFKEATGLTANSYRKQYQK